MRPVRIAFTSDNHRTPKDYRSKSLWPNHMARIGEEAEKKLYAQLVESIHLADEAFFRWLDTEPPFDMIIHLGDATGGFLEEGCHEAETRSLLAAYYQRLRTYTPEVYGCPGQHDLGYGRERFMNVSLPGAGLSMESLCAFREIAGHLWWSQKIFEFLFLGICSSLADYEADDPAILELKNEQNDFLKRKLHSHNGPIVLCTHDWQAPRHLNGNLQYHTQRIHRMIFGDLHNRFSGKIVKALYYPFPGLQAHCMRRSFMVGSVAPLWCNGHRAAIATVTPEKFTIHSVQFPPLPEYKKPPTTNLVRSAVWMIPTPAWWKLPWP